VIPAGVRRMSPAKDVDQALRDIATVHGGLDEAGAVAYLQRLAADKRYVRDVY
jgi:sulfite reductase (NADPH) flavoprotein alpha-component